MVSPLALVKVPYQKGHIWRVLFTSTWLEERGALAVILLREPTEKELEVFKRAVPGDDTVWMLDELLLHAMMEKRRRDQRELEPPL